MATLSKKIMVIGFGTVGQGFFELLRDKRNLNPFSGAVISEIVDMKIGHISNPGPHIIEEINRGKRFPHKDVVEAIRESDADIVCEFTWVNFKDAEPAHDHIMTALQNGKDVITTNKGPIALRYAEIMAEAAKRGLKVKFKGTVMAGTPSFNLTRLIPGAQVTGIRGILNGTTNYILTRMAEGMSFSASLKEAQDKGYAEADPTNDIDGYDAAAKAVILSNVFGWGHTMKNIALSGIRNVTPEEASGGTKLIVRVDARQASVSPEKLQESDILRHVNGVMNAIEISTDTLGMIYSLGPGAGRKETAQAAMSDLAEIINSKE